MRVTIWDLDYYYAKKKVNCFNPLLMKLSSYHKQKGDEVTFVLTEYDIRRPFDIYYVCREKKNCAMPPSDFFMNNKVRWIGAANKFRSWAIPDVVYACRPDYLLYPEKSTVWERSEQIRLLDGKGKILPRVQDWDNVFKNKRVLITDDGLWTTSVENLKIALKTLAGIKNLTFLEPIWIQKLVSDKDIEDLFFQLNFNQGSNIQFLPIFTNDYYEAARLVEKIKATWPTATVGPIVIKYKPSTHWEDRQMALKEFEDIKKIIIDSKKRAIAIKIVDLKDRLDTPYFAIFETITNWLNCMPQRSWLEYLSMSVGHAPYGKVQEFWNNPADWNEMFRSLLMQTYQDKEFLLAIWKEKRISENDVPWVLWDKEFELGI